MEGWPLQLLCHTIVSDHQCPFFIKNCSFWFEFQWNLFINFQLRIHRYLFMIWLGATRATYHCLNISWPNPLTYFWITRPQWVNLFWKFDNMLIFSTFVFIRPDSTTLHMRVFVCVCVWVSTAQVPQYFTELICAIFSHEVWFVKPSLKLLIFKWPHQHALTIIVRYVPTDGKTPLDSTMHAELSPSSTENTWLHIMCLKLSAFLYAVVWYANKRIQPNCHKT